MRYLQALIASLVASAASAAPPQTLTLQVQKMTCGTCPIVVRKALEHVPGVQKVAVDFDRKIAVVTFDPDRVTTATLTDATTNAGFPSSPVNPR